MGKFKVGDRVFVLDTYENRTHPKLRALIDTIQVVSETWHDPVLKNLVRIATVPSMVGFFERRFELAYFKLESKPEATPDPLGGWSLGWHTKAGDQVAVADDGSVKIRAAGLNGERNNDTDWDVIIPAAVAYEILMDSNEKRGHR